MSARDIALALGGRRAKPLTDGSFVVPCPVPSHGKGRGDRRPSLQIRDGEARLLVRCHAGCRAVDVLAELRRRGLTESTRSTAIRTAPARAAERQCPDAHERAQHRKAAWLWLHRQPIEGTIAEKYLREA